MIKWLRRKDSTENKVDDKLEPTTIGKESIAESITESVSESVTQNDTAGKIVNDPDIKLVKEITESIDTINEKLSSVKKEYNVAVGDLFSIKKELATKKRESIAANAVCDSLQRRANVLDKQLERFEFESSKVQTSVHDAKVVSDELLKVNSELDEQQKKLGNVRKAILGANLELDIIQKKTKMASAKLEESGNLLQKAHIMIKEKNVSKNASSGDVLRTASTMMASLNNQITLSKKEVDVLRNVLDKERKEHVKTRIKLASIERDKDSN